MLLKEFLSELLYVILIFVAPVIATYLCKILSIGFNFLKTWTKTKKFAKYIEMAEEDLRKIVIATTETFVKQLKEADKFDNAAKLEAFNQSKNTFLSIINTDTLLILQEAKEDLDEWIRVTIEDYVQAQKNQVLAQTNSPQLLSVKKEV